MPFDQTAATGDNDSALVELLEKFNRKERYWLLRDLIGRPFETISSEFRRKLEGEISTHIPERVWWAFDYHIDWLVAVLRTFPAQPKLNKWHDNEALTPSSTARHAQASSDARAAQPPAQPQREIKGNQEDFDLIIAFDQEIILVEAKTGYFSNSQLNSKLSRLNGIVSADGRTKTGVRISFILSAPPKRDFKKLNEGQFFPPWALKNGKPFLIELPINDDLLMISRCANLLTNHKIPKRDAKGEYWAIYKS